MIVSQGLVVIDVIIWEGGEPVCLPHMMAVVEGRTGDFKTLADAMTYAERSGVLLPLPMHDRWLGFCGHYCWKCGLLGEMWGRGEDGKRGLCLMAFPGVTTKWHK